jgi:hypothetical protein
LYILWLTYFNRRYWTNQCTEIFGPEFNATSIDLAVFNINILSGVFNYGGTNTIFINGKIDPWHSLSLFGQNPNNESEIILMNETAHCQDLSPSSSSDSVELKQTRLKIISLINDYLSINGFTYQNFSCNFKSSFNLILFFFLLTFVDLINN